jgi:hypothetical protein
MSRKKPDDVARRCRRCCARRPMTTGTFARAPARRCGPPAMVELAVIGGPAPAVCDGPSRKRGRNAGLTGVPQTRHGGRAIGLRCIKTASGESLEGRAQTGVRRTGVASWQRIRQDGTGDQAGICVRRLVPPRSETAARFSSAVEYVHERSRTPVDLGRIERSRQSCVCVGKGADHKGNTRSVARALLLRRSKGEALSSRVRCGQYKYAEISKWERDRGIARSALVRRAWPSTGISIQAHHRIASR